MVTRKKAPAKTPPKSEPPSPEAIPNFLHEIAELIKEESPAKGRITKQHLWLDVTPEDNVKLRDKKVFATLIRDEECSEFKQAFKNHSDLIKHYLTIGQNDPDHPLSIYARLSGFPLRLMPFGDTANSAGWSATNIQTLLPDKHMLDGKNALATKLGNTQIHFVVPENIDEKKPKWRRIELVVPADKAEEVVPKERRIPSETIPQLLTQYPTSAPKEGILPRENPRQQRFNAENLVMMAHNATFSKAQQGTFALKIPVTMLPALKQHLNKLGITDSITQQDNMPAMVASQNTFQKAFGDVPAIAHAKTRISSEGAQRTTISQTPSGGRSLGSNPQSKQYWWHERDETND